MVTNDFIDLIINGPTIKGASKLFVSGILGLVSYHIVKTYDNKKHMSQYDQEVSELVVFIGGAMLVPYPGLAIGILSPQIMCYREPNSVHTLSGLLIGFGLQTMYYLTFKRNSIY